MLSAVENFFFGGTYDTYLFNELCRLLRKWQNISTVILKKKTDDATMQKNAKILEKGLVQTKSFFSKECEEVL